MKKMNFGIKIMEIKWTFFLLSFLSLGNQCPIQPPPNEFDSFSRLITTTLSDIKGRYGAFRVTDYNIGTLEPLSSSFHLTTEVGSPSFVHYTLDIWDVYARGFSDLRLRSGAQNMVFVPENKSLSFWVVTDSVKIEGNYKLNFSENLELQISGEGSFILELRDIETLLTIVKENNPMPVARTTSEFTACRKVTNYDMPGLQSNVSPEKYDQFLSRQIVPLIKNNYLPDLIHRLGIFIQEIINDQLQWNEGNASA